MMGHSDLIERSIKRLVSYQDYFRDYSPLSFFVTCGEKQHFCDCFWYCRGAQ